MGGPIAAIYSIIQRFGGNSPVVMHDGWVEDFGVVHGFAPAPLVYENTETGQHISAKELLIKDLLPELEQATDIKQRIETVRKPVVPSVPAPQVGWSMLGNSFAVVNTTNSWITLADTAQRQAYERMMSNSLQNARRQP